MIFQTAFKNRKDQMIVYKFENEQLFCSNGEVIGLSANEYKKRTARGENLKVVPVSKSNWKRTARVHADKLGYFKSVDVTISEKIDFDNPPQPDVIDNTPYAFIEEALRKERF